MTLQVMDASGQTVEERRQLRLEQRNLKNLIIEQQAVSEWGGREGGGGGQGVLDWYVLEGG